MSNLALRLRVWHLELPGVIGLIFLYKAIVLCGCVAAPTKHSDVSENVTADWYHQVGSVDPGTGNIFLLLGVRSAKGRLEGDFIYGARGAKTSDPDLMALSRYQNSWPTVTADVSNTNSGPWNRVGKSSNLRKLFVPSGHPTDLRMLHIYLDVFRPKAAYFRYGKVTLQNGDVAIFELKELMPRREKAE